MAKVAKKPKTLNYVLREELYEDKPFSVKLQPMSALDFARLEDKVSAYHNKTGVIFMNNQEFYYNICKHGIKYWSNLLDEEGTKIEPEFENGLLSDESLDLIISDIEEIGSVLNAITRNPSSIATYESLQKNIAEELKKKDTNDTKSEKK